MEYNDENQIIGQTSTEYRYGLDKLKVGDMPQTAYVGGLTIKPIKGLSVQGLYRYHLITRRLVTKCREVELGEPDPITRESSYTVDMHKYGVNSLW